jgi:hypothetical protein
MGYLGTTDIWKLEKLVEAVKIRKESELGVCEDCLAGKQYRTPSHEPSLCSENSGGLIHSDTSGKIEPTVLGRFNYYDLFIDDAIHMMYFAPMKTNGLAEMYIYLKLFAKTLKTELGAKIK